MKIELRGAYRAIKIRIMFAREQLPTLIQNWNRKEAGGRKKLKRIDEAVGYRG